MNVLVTAATEMEWKPLQEMLSQQSSLAANSISIRFYTAGVGLMRSTLLLYKELSTCTTDLILQIGIAGSLNAELSPGSVVMVEKEYLGDTGVEEGGKFNDIFDLNLAGENEFPFLEKALINPYCHQYNSAGFPLVNGISVNEITTQAHRIDHLNKKYAAQIETMEGAALHFVALYTNTPFVQLRAISNLVGERDKSKWLIKHSLEQLTLSAAKFIGHLHVH